MIPITHLRPGNKVLREDGTIGEVAYIIPYSNHPLKYVRFTDNIDRDPESLSGIPLTPVILERCGFEKSLSQDVHERTIYSIQVANGTSLYFDAHKDHMRDDLYVEWYLSHEWNNNHFKNDFWKKPKYVHELQNLFLALTGDELPIDL